MEKEERKEIYQQSYEHWGVTNQAVKLMEESAELIKSTAKLFFSQGGDLPFENHIEELADTYIMIEQLVHSLDIEDKFNKTIEQKMLRVQQRLKS